jgi:endonuclease/exonuclease/phosphatase (EEP) superfamily protein YafD
VLKVLTFIVLFLGVFFSVTSFASLLKPFYWLFDVLTHFSFQYAIALACCLLLGIAIGIRPYLSSLFAVALVINLYFLVPFFWPRRVGDANSSPLRVVSLNVLTSNQDYETITTYLRETNADIVLLSEIEPELMTVIKSSLADFYPHVYNEAMEGTHGLALVSRLPFVQTETILLGERHHRFLTAELQWQGKRFKIYGSHPHAPLSGRWAKSRDEEIKVIREHIKQESKPHILLGDFNASPWSTPMTQLSAQTNLRHGALGLGIYPTWRYKTMLLGAPIDHILVSEEWQVSSYKVERDVGSDHFPVLAELQLP